MTPDLRYLWRAAHVQAINGTVIKNKVPRYACVCTCGATTPPRLSTTGVKVELSFDPMRFFSFTAVPPCVHQSGSMPPALSYLPAHSSVGLALLFPTPSTRPDTHHHLHTWRPPNTCPHSFPYNEYNCTGTTQRVPCGMFDRSSTLSLDNRRSP